MKYNTANQREWPASIRHLKVFDSVAQLNGIQRASEECHVSQPAVTQALAKLEEQIGVTVLQRCSRGTFLNEFGEIFHRRTQRFFAQLERALEELGVPHVPVSLARVASRISRSQLLSLIATVETGSFEQAAQTLDLSQASLHRSVRDLERTLHIALFTQTAFGMVATPAASEFARRIKLAQREIELGLEEVETAKGNSDGEIVIGAMRVAGSVMLASVINEFTISYPNANIRVLTGTPKEMMRNLRCGDVDAVISLLQDPGSADLVQEPLGDTPYVAVARHGHPLVHRSSVTIEELSRYEWVIGTSEGGRRARFDRLFSGHTKPLVRIEANSLPTIRVLLAQSDRLTLLTSYELMCEEDILTSVPYFGSIEPVPSFGLTTRENWLPTQRQASFIQMIRKRIVLSLLPSRESQRASANRTLVSSL
jgi:LysR family transcriptional regulator, regulator for genes of the gallate degradation pathway